MTPLDPIQVFASLLPLVFEAIVLQRTFRWVSSRRLMWSGIGLTLFAHSVYIGQQTDLIPPPHSYFGPYLLGVIIVGGLIQIGAALMRAPKSDWFAFGLALIALLLPLVGVILLLSMGS